MRREAYTASDTESVEEGGDSGIGTKHTCAKEGGAGKRMKLAATVLNPLEDEGGSCGIGADGGAVATVRKIPRGGAYSNAKSGDLWMHTIN
jgi:hypothetical protein